MMKILIVDDEEDDRFHLERILKKSGHEVVTADSREEAARAYREDSNHIDLVITDFRMPRNDDGLGLIADIKAIWSDARIWLATSHLNEDTERRALDLGAEKAIQKIDLRHELFKAGIVSS